jgi:hypothetical protein
MRERPVTITIFGILNIGFGLLGLGWVLLSKLLEGFDFSRGGASLSAYFSTMAAIWDAINKDPAFALWNQISFPLDIVAGVALTAAGLGLLLLKNWSRLVSNGWAVYTIISVFVNLAVLFVALYRVLAGALHTSSTGDVVLVLMLAAIGAALTLAYPILLLYFMARPNVVQAFQREPVAPNAGII